MPRSVCTSARAASNWAKLSSEERFTPAAIEPSGTDQSDNDGESKSYEIAHNQKDIRFLAEEQGDNRKGKNRCGAAWNENRTGKSMETPTMMRTLSA